VICTLAICTVFGIWGQSAIGARPGRVRAWGENGNGQLGDDSTDPRLEPITVHDLRNVKKIEGGCRFALAVKRNGTVWAWGLNLHGELGNDSTDDSHVPVKVQDLTNVTAIAAGDAVSEGRASRAAEELD
jgi:alpha-tubulin suppressor-like RCC1 family protein